MRSPVPSTTDNELDDMQVRRRADHLAACLEQARSTHDRCVEQMIKIRDRRISRYETIIAHLVDVVERKEQPCEWVLREARTAAARAKP